MVGADIFRNLSRYRIVFHLSVHEPAQQGQHKKLGDKVSRNRMTGQTNQGFHAGLSQNGGFAGFDGNAMEQQAAHRFDNPAGCVLDTYTAAAGEQHSVTFRYCHGYFLGKQILIVDDVISTGESLRVLEALVEQAGGTVCGRMAILAEGDAYKRDDIVYLEKLPLFNKDGQPI